MDNNSIQIKNEVDLNIDDSMSIISSDDSSSNDLFAVCRGCLQKGFRMQNLFDDELHIYKMLQELTPALHICSGDDLPQQMCPDCVKNLKQAIAFKKRIESVDDLLRRSENTKKSDVSNENEATQTDQRLDETFLGSNVSSSSRPPVNDFPIVSDQNGKSDRIDRTKTKKPVRESERKTAKKFVCQKCEQTFASDDMLLQHMTSHEATKDEHKCAQCRMKFTFIEDLKLHALIHSKTNIWRCSNCHKKFKNRTELKQHILYHFKEKPLECDSCGKCFVTKTSLRSHWERHHGKGRPKKFECQMCPKKYSWSNNLEIHQRVHTGVRPFQCQECDNSFQSAANLRSHQKVHEDEKQFECEICLKRFKHDSSLTAHTRAIHTNEKPYSCQHCPMAFVNSSKLSRHQSVHFNKPKTTWKKYRTGQWGNRVYTI